MVIETKPKVNSKIDKEINKSLYNWIMHHTQVVQSTIVNNFLKVKIDGHTEPQLVTRLLLQVFVRELHNSLVSDTDNVGLKEARDAENNIIISDYILHSILPLQLKKMSSRYKVMCGCKCCISAKSIHSSLLSWSDSYFKKLKDLRQNAQNRRSGEKANHIYETYKNTVMRHGRHIYAKASDMPKAKICANP